MDRTRQFATLAKWALKESAKLAEEWPPGGRDEVRLLEDWQADRPRMMRELAAHEGAAAALAHVLTNRNLDAMQANLQAGMPVPDAREQAERDWLLRSPESDD